MPDVSIPQNIANMIARFCGTSVIPEDVAHAREVCESLWRAGYWFSKAETTNQKAKVEAAR